MNSEYWRSVIFKIECGNQNGSCFLINETTLMTVSHVISSYDDKTEIKVKIYNDKEISARPLNENWKNTPITILGLSAKIEVTPPTILVNCIEEDQEINILGFLGDSLNHNRVKGEVLQVFSDNEIVSDSNVEIKAEDSITNYEGFSGSPVIKDNCVQGILIKQQNQNGTSIRINAICNKLFVSHLENLGINYQHQRIEKTKSVEVSGLTQHIELMEEITNQNKLIFNKLFKGLESEVDIDSWEKLTKFVSNLQKSCDTDDNKSKYYYFASIWAMDRGEKSLSVEYLEKAIILKPNIDKRLYDAKIKICDGKYCQARKILGNIDDINILNYYLLCLFQEGKSLDEANIEIELSQLELNSESYKTLTMFNLRESKYEEAHKMIDLALSNNIQNYTYKMKKVLVYYAQVLYNILGISVIDFEVITQSNHIITIDDRNLIEQALEILKELERMTIGTENYVNVLIAKFILRNLSGDKHIHSIIRDIQEIDRMSEYAILLSIEVGYEIDEKIKEYFLKLKINEQTSNSIIATKYELAIYTSNYDIAQELLVNHHSQICKFTGIPVVESQALLYIKQEKYADAIKLISKSNIDTDAKYRLNLMIAMKKDTKITRTEAKEYIKYADKTKNSIDYRNANFICRKFEFYKEMKLNAQNWFKNTNELRASFNLIEVLILLHDYKKAFKKLTAIEKLVGDTEEVKIMKVHCLDGLSQYREALEISNKLSHDIKTPNLVCVQADIYINLGNRDDAIELLEDFANEIVDKFVYLKLIEIIKGEKPEKASEYAYNLYQTYTYDDTIVAYCAEIGFNSEHKELSSIFFERVLSGRNSSVEVMKYDIKETIELIQRENKKALEKYEDLRNGKVPLHAYATSTTSPMGQIIYDNIEYNGVLCNFVSQEQELCEEMSNIILDYTMCASLLHFNLFDKIFEIYDKVYIHKRLLGIITLDEQKAYSNQCKIIDKKIKLFNHMKTLKYTVVDTNDFATREGYSRSEDIDVFSAKKYDLRYLADRKNVELEDKLINEEWFDFLINLDEFNCKLSELQISEQEYEKSNIRTEVIENIKVGDNILINLEQLQSFFELGALDNIFSTFNIFVCNSTIRELEESESKKKYELECVSWLVDLRSKLKEYTEDGKIKFLPNISNESSDNHHYIDLIREEVQFVYENGYSLGVDDRMLTQFKCIETQKGKSANILSTMDIINLLARNNKLSQIEEFQIYDKMINQKYKFFIPPVEYIFNKLNLTKVDENGVLIENSQLMNIRRYIELMQSKECGVSMLSARQLNQIEKIKLVTQINKLKMDIFKLIFNCNKEREWKDAAASWIFMVFGNNFIRCSFDEINIDLRCADLVFLITQMLDLQNEDYYIWFEKCITPIIVCSDKMNEKLTMKTYDFLDSFTNRENQTTQKLMQSYGDKEFTELAVYCIVKILENLPSKLKFKVLQNAQDKKWKKYIKVDQSITLQSDQLEIKVSIAENTEINIDKIIEVDEDEFEKAICLMIYECEIKGKEFLEKINEDMLKRVAPENRYRMYKFLSDLSLYLPCELQLGIIKKKEYITLL